MPDAAMLLPTLDPFFFGLFFVALLSPWSFSLVCQVSIYLTYYCRYTLQGMPSLSLRLESPTDGAT